MRHLIVFVLCLAGCSTSEKKVAPESPIAPPSALKEATMAVRVGEVRRYYPPYPSGTDILITWSKPDGIKEEVLGFRGWDFDGKGTFGMLDVLSSQGAVETTLYDFDGDGKVDN